MAPIRDAGPGDFPGHRISERREAEPQVPLGIYLHVPWCRRRCGYCAFNTWVLDADDPDATAAAGRAFAGAVDAEVDLADSVLGNGRPPLTSVFVGGGTPSLLDPAVLGSALASVLDRFEVAADLEVTVEANPDDVDDRWLARTRELGATRLSVGMQSAAPRVLELLDRLHDPERPASVVERARSAGFDHVSLDLIIGTPGESATDWERTLDVALGAPVDHLSAYALSIEPGTKLAARVRDGRLGEPSGDEAAQRYEVLDRRARSVGLEWYELSNWATDTEARCRHNLLTWQGHDWWGIGPGAHSHVRGVRWWNVDRPDDWAQRLAGGSPPAAGWEVLTDEQRSLERIMLGMRLAEGLPVEDVDADEADRLSADGLVDLRGERVVLTLAGRLLADLVVRRLAVAQKVVESSS